MKPSAARPWPALAAAALLATGIGVAHAAQPVADAAERDRITVERQAVEARFEQQRRACEQQFAVTSCVEEARRRQRESLASLRRQQALLDEAQRRQRAAGRVEAIRNKVSAEEARQREQVGNPRREPALRTMAPRAGPAARAASTPNPTVPAAATSAERESSEGRSRARYEARQREAREHREAAQRRSVQRDRSGRQSAPLTPAAPASAP